MSEDYYSQSEIDNKKDILNHYKERKYQDSLDKFRVLNRSELRILLMCLDFMKTINLAYQIRITAIKDIALAIPLNDNNYDEYVLNISSGDFVKWTKGEVEYLNKAVDQYKLHTVFDYLRERYGKRENTGD